MVRSAACQPRKRYVRQSRIAVAAADIRMHAGKPHLLDGLAILRRARPQIRLEGSPALVDGERLISVFYIFAKLCIVKADTAPGEAPQKWSGGAKRAHRVPHADERIPLSAIRALEIDRPVCRSGNANLVKDRNYSPPRA